MSGENGALLRLSGINTYYGLIHILQDVEIEVGEGELVSLLGGNASGKSTTLKTILGIVRPRTGSVVYSTPSVPATRVRSQSPSRAPTRARCRRSRPRPV